MKPIRMLLIIISYFSLISSIDAQLPYQMYERIPDDWDSLNIHRKTTSVSDISPMSFSRNNPYLMWSSLPNENIILAKTSDLEYGMFSPPIGAFKAAFDHQNLYIVLKIIDHDYTGLEEIHLTWAPYSDYVHSGTDSISGKDALAYWNHLGAYSTIWIPDSVTYFYNYSSMWDFEDWKRIKRDPSPHLLSGDSIRLEQHSVWRDDTLFMVCKIPFESAMNGFVPYIEGPLIAIYPIPTPEIALEVGYLNMSTYTDESIHHWWNSPTNDVIQTMLYSGIGSFGNFDTIHPPPSPQPHKITIPDVTGNPNLRGIQLPIKTSSLDSAKKIISYQFDLFYDNSLIKYGLYELSQTLSAKGQLAINNSAPGLLRVSFMSNEPLSGQGSLINLQFWPTGRSGTSQIIIKNFKYNTRDITNIKQGSITLSNILKGDVDFDGSVLAFDAAITLQFAVGLNPLPIIDPLPWEPKRIKAADMDNNALITGWDATLILRKSIGLEPHPVWPCWKDSFNIMSTDLLYPCYDIKDTSDGRFIYFYSIGDVYAFDIQHTKIEGDAKLFEPEIITEVNSALFQDENNLSVALSSAYPIKSANNLLMKIPYAESGKATFEVLINNKEKIIEMELVKGVTSISDNLQKEYNPFPNPANDFLNINGNDILKIQIYTLNGTLVLDESSINKNLNISNLKNGNYIVKITTQNDIFTRKLAVIK